MKTALFLWVLAAGLPLAFTPAYGQISALKKAVEGKEPAEPSATEKPEDARKRLEQWHREAQEALTGMDGAGAEAALPAGVTPAEMEERRRNLEQISVTSTRSIKNLTAITEAQKALEEARAEETAWTGFKEKPPYSILIIDELLNERDATKAKLTSFESALANYERLLGTTTGEAKAAEEAVNSAIVAVQDADPANNGAAKWRLEAARTKARMLASRLGLMQRECETLKVRISAAKADLALLDRKVKTTSADSRFNDEDLAKLQKISTERKNNFQKEITAISKRLKAATANRALAQSTLDALVSSSTPGAVPEGLDIAKFRLEVADSRAESLQGLIEGIEGLIQLENLNLEVYRDRRKLIEATRPDERSKALQPIATALERVRAWENVIDNEIASSSADLSKLESRAASITSEDPRFPLINEQRAAKSENLAMLQRLAQGVVSERKLIKRWMAEHAPKPGDMSFSERVANFTGSAWGMVRKFWTIEVMSFDNSVEVDGRIIRGKAPVTLGLLLRAVLFFVIGYWISSHLAHRLQKTIVTRGHVAEAQARTMRNWAMIVVGILLALGTLAFLKIPLTVFAFFGGALAIGLGFGLQTLIKNFISGIIVLVERKVRVGDILDVDGFVGTVTEVNTRSSVIRSPDDVETMIPNSMFLESRVTNWTLSSGKMRRKITLGVAYGTDPRSVMEILTGSAGRHGQICRDPAPFAIFEDFGDNALIFTLFFWVDMRGTGNAMVIASDLRLMIEKCFTEAGIGIPFPQRDMHLTTDHPIKVEISNPPA